MHKKTHEDFFFVWINIFNFFVVIQRKKVRKRFCIFSILDRFRSRIRFSTKRIRIQTGSVSKWLIRNTVLNYAIRALSYHIKQKSKGFVKIILRWYWVRYDTWDKLRYTHWALAVSHSWIQVWLQKNCHSFFKWCGSVSF